MPSGGGVLVVHGDDFTALGNDHGLDRYEAGMKAAFDIKLRGRLGSSPGDTQEIKILNRILRVTPKGLCYEADPRHVELLARALGLEQSRAYSTPGVKQCHDDHVADGLLQHEDEAQQAIAEYVQSLLPSPPRSRARSKVKFDAKVQVHEIPLLAEVYGHHPRRFVYTGPIWGTPSSTACTRR